MIKNRRATMTKKEIADMGLSLAPPLDQAVEYAEKSKFKFKLQGYRSQKTIIARLFKTCKYLLDRRGSVDYKELSVIYDITYPNSLNIISLYAKVNPFEVFLGVGKTYLDRYIKYHNNDMSTVHGVLCFCIKRLLKASKVRDWDSDRRYAYGRRLKALAFLISYEVPLTGYSKEVNTYKKGIYDYSETTLIKYKNKLIGVFKKDGFNEIMLVSKAPYVILKHKPDQEWNNAILKVEWEACTDLLLEYDKVIAERRSLEEELPW